MVDYMYINIYKLRVSASNIRKYIILTQDLIHSSLQYILELSQPEPIKQI